jgi:hypothetical protein
MVFLTDRDLERLVSLRASWRRDYLDEVAQLLRNHAVNGQFRLNMSAQVDGSGRAADPADV